MNTKALCGCCSILKVSRFLFLVKFVQSVLTFSLPVFTSHLQKKIYEYELKAFKYSQLESLSRYEAFLSLYEQFQGKHAVYSFSSCTLVGTEFLPHSLCFRCFQVYFFFLQLKLIIIFAFFSFSNHYAEAIFLIKQKAPDSVEHTLY